MTVLSGPGLPMHVVVVCMCQAIAERPRVSRARTRVSTVAAIERDTRRPCVPYLKSGVGALLGSGISFVSRNHETGRTRVTEGISVTMTHTARQLEGS